MMMQTEPIERPVSERQVGSRLAAVARGVAGVLVVGLLAPLVTGGAFAERTIAHARPKALAAQTERAKNAGRSGKAGAARSGARHTAEKGAGERAHAAPKTAKPETHAKLRSRRRAEPVDESEPVVMHRAASSKAARGHEPQTVRLVARSRVPRLAKMPVEATESAVEPGKTLTVDDFMRAAAPAADDATVVNGKTYVRGESHTEVDDRISDEPAVIAPRPRILALKPIAKKPAPAVARVEPNPPAGVVAASIPSDDMTMVTPPDDLTGAPVVAASDVPAPVSSRRAAKTAIAPLPLLSRQQVTEEVEQPIVLPGLYRNGRLVVPAPLKGTHEILVHQNLMADDEGLERIEDDYDLRRLRAAHLLVDYPESASLHINPELAADRRCGRVWAVRFASTIARDFYARFHQPLQVNSAVRTVAFQVRLQRTNGNAAGIDGDTASPHLTGQAMDLGKRNMSMAQIAWMRSYLLPLMQAGKVDVEEEFQQACFHISVYRSYMPSPVKRSVPRNEVAQLREPRVKRSQHADDLR
jgi:hypothetical protein